jgi:hypothetical protein
MKAPGIVAALYRLIAALAVIAAGVDLEAVAAQLPAGSPRRGLAGFRVAAGLVTLVVWGLPLGIALVRDGSPDRLDSYTTAVTYALDLAIITPATFLCAFL